MTPATLGEIANLGHEEKQAAREYQSLPIAEQEGVEYGETWQAFAFLQGILWERKRTASRVAFDVDKGAEARLLAMLQEEGK